MSAAAAVGFSSGVRPPSCLLTHFQPCRAEGAGAASGAAPGSALHATVELWALPAATPLASFHVTSTVKTDGRQSGGGNNASGGGSAGGRIDLLAPFCGFVAATFTDSARLAIYCMRTHTKHGQSTLPERARCMLAESRGRFLVLGSPTGWLRLYALQSGALVRALRTHHDRGINCMQLDADGHLLVVGGEDGVISVYDFARLCQLQAPGASASQQSGAALQQSALLLSISDHNLAITSLHITASKYLLSASKDGSVRVYRLDVSLQNAPGSAASSSSSGSSAPAPPCLFHYSFRGVVTSAVMDVSESIIYAACKDNVHWIALYPSALAMSRSGGAGSGSNGPAPIAHTWRGHQSSVLSLLLPPSGSSLLSLDAEGMIKMWDCGLSASAAAPPAQGSCVKNLGRRQGCKNLAFIDSADLAHGQNQVGTSNSWLSQHAVKGSSATGLQGRDGGWIFPPLHAHAPSPFLFVAVGLPLSAQGQGVNQELKLVERKRKKRSFGQLTSASSFGGGLAREESVLVDSGSSTSSRFLRPEWELVSGTSGWSSLAASASSRGDTVERLQLELEQSASDVKQLYQLAVDKIWKDIKTQTGAGPKEADRSKQ
jgi:hypothetical protein